MILCEGNENMKWECEDLDVLAVMYHTNIKHPHRGRKVKILFTLRSFAQSVTLEYSVLRCSKRGRSWFQRLSSGSFQIFLSPKPTFPMTWSRSVSSLVDIWGWGGISIVKCFCYVDLMPTVLHTVDHKMIKAHLSCIILQENRNTVWKSWCSQVWTQSEISNRLIACNYYSCIVHLSTLEDQNKRRIHTDKVHDKPLLHIHQFYFLQQNRDECNTLTYGNTGQRNILLTEEQTLKKGRRINQKHMISHYIPEDDKQNQVWNYLT